MWTLVILGLNCLIVLGGVRKGIERVSNLLMPLLFVLLLTLALNSLLLPGAADGLAFLFRPDFSTVAPESFSVPWGRPSSRCRWAWVL